MNKNVHSRVGVRHRAVQSMVQVNAASFPTAFSSKNYVDAMRRSS